MKLGFDVDKTPLVVIWETNRASDPVTLMVTRPGKPILIRRN